MDPISCIGRRLVKSNGDHKDQTRYDGNRKEPGDIFGRLKKDK